MTFDVAFTSVLKRAIKTLYLIQDGCDLHWIPVHRHWRLNERMYGALQGLNKSETAAKHGEDQVKVRLMVFCDVVEADCVISKYVRPGITRTAMYAAPSRAAHW